MANGSAYRYLAFRRRRRNGNHKGMPKWLLLLAALGGLLLVGTVVMTGAGFAAYQNCISDLRDPEQAIAELPRGGARIYDRNGELLYEYLNPTYGYREQVDVEDTSLWLVAATVATEDASFFDNPGINIRGLARAGWENFSPFADTPGFLQGSGGSSITQQLVKNVYFSPEERVERSIERKWKEVCYSLELTQRYDKAQILEWYLSVISYGNLYTGIESASHGYFGKPSKELTLAEAAFLAGIPASPDRYDPINNFDEAKRRQIQVLFRMEEEGYITPATVWEAATQPIEIRPQRFPIQAPHFVFSVVQPWLDHQYGPEAKYRDGLEVHTTLDMNLQREAERIMEEQISAFEAQGGLGHNGSFVAIDPESAEVLIYVGSRDFFNEDIQGRNDMAQALNSPGSSFKPITYLTTMMELGWGPGNIIYDDGISREFWDGEALPCNPNGCYAVGPITIRNALGNSLNVPAVKAMLHAGVDNVLAQGRRMGLTTLDEEDQPFLGPAFTVGGGDVKLYDMVYAYTAFPNLGMQKGVETILNEPEGNRNLDPIVVTKVIDRDGNQKYPLGENDRPLERPEIQEERVAPAAETYLVNDILIDPNAECETFGCNRLSIPNGQPLAVKTGTSAPYPGTRQTGDTWTMAYSPHIVAGVWYGNADNSPIGFASSTTVAWPIMQEFMTFYHQDKPIEQFQRPPDVVEAQTCVVSNFQVSEDCPRTNARDLYAKSALPWLQEENEGEEPPPPPPEGEQPPPEEEIDDPLWEVAEIDVRSGLLASDLTPPGLVERRYFLTLPPGLSEFNRAEAINWARRVGATIGGSPPEDVTGPEDISAIITTPPNGAEVQPPVEITGRARGAWRLEVKEGISAGGEGWTVIAQSNNPVEDGVLGVWNPRPSRPEGAYTLRLTVVAGDREIVILHGIVLTRPDPTPTPPEPPPPPAPTPTPSDGGGGQGAGFDADLPPGLRRGR